MRVGVADELDGQVPGLGDLAAIHVHTASPETVFPCAARCGTLTTRRADNTPERRRRLGLRPGTFYPKRHSARTPPTTSPPTPGDSARLYHSARKEADAVVAMHRSGTLPGTVRRVENRASNQPAGGGDGR